MPNQVGAEVNENGSANSSAKIPHRAGDSEQRIENQHPDPKEERDVVESAKEKRCSRRMQGSEHQRANPNGERGAFLAHGQET